MKKLEIDIDKLIAVAVDYMDDDGDVRWSIGMALQVMYGDKGWDEVQQRLIRLYRNQAEDERVETLLKGEAYVFDASQEPVVFAAPRSLEIANAMNKIILERKVK